MRKITLIVEQSAEEVALTDTNGNVEYVNPAFKKPTGYLPEGVKGKNPKVLKSGRHPAEFYKNIWHGHFINKNKNGNIYYEDAVIFPIFDDTGKTINYAKIARDVTKQKEMENSLWQQQELLKALINSAPDIICFKDSELARYSNFYHDVFMACEKSDEIAWQEGTISHGIEIIPRPYDTEKVYDVIKSPLFNEDGSRKGLVVLGRDIIEIMETVSALEKSEKKYREISRLYRLMADNVPDLIWAKDLKGKFIFVNKAGCEKSLNAKDTDESIGKNDMFFANRQRAQHPNQKDWFTFGELCVDSDKVTLKAKNPMHFDEFGNVQGKFLFLDVRNAPLFDEKGDIMGTVDSGRIVTREKEIEKNLIENEKRYRRIFKNSQDAIFLSSPDGCFLDTNPVGLKLYGYSSLSEIQKINIAKDLYVNPSDHLEYLKKMQTDGFVKNYEVRLKNKNDSEIIALNNATAVSINQVIPSIYRMLRRLIDDDIHIEKIMAENLPDIKADKSQIEQIFFNLMVNTRDAINAVTKYNFLKKIIIETGQVDLDKAYVDEHPCNVTGRHIFFAVSDNGIGMDEKTATRFFEPFFTTKGKFKGTGTILVVEDENEVRRFVSKSLMSLGYSVYKITNGKLALDLIKKEKIRPDLILTDLIMPELNGKEFVEKIKKFLNYKGA